jgi:Flp pilus assembly protein TadG
MRNPLSAALVTLFARLWRERAGNVMMIMGFMLVPLTFTVGFGLDYGRAQQMQTKLSALADSAALVAVSPNMMGQSDATAVAAATAYFNGQLGNLPGITITGLTITAPTYTSGSLAGTRVATVVYHGTSRNLFSTILGATTLPVSGVAQANSSLPPSINFYVMLDTSPSMLLPTTTVGINALKTATKSSTWTNGCAFACHTKHIESIPMTTYDSSGNILLMDANFFTTGNAGYNLAYRYNASSKKVFNQAGTQIGTGASLGSGSGSRSFSYKNMSGTSVSTSVYYADSWWLARNYGSLWTTPNTITLRVDAETDAARNLISYAQTTVNNYNTASHPVTYKMQLYSFSYGNPSALSGTPSLIDVNSLGSSSVPDLGWNLEWLYNFNYWTSSSTVTNDADTDFTTMLTKMNTAIPNPGTGSTPSSPQAVMFIVTDGMADEMLSGYSCQSSGRICTQLTTSHVALCKAIKDRGIRIAVLYTEYLASSISGSGLSFAETVASSNVPYVETQLRACASTNADGSQLFYKVSTDGDLSAALTKLFAMAVQTAHLVR